MAALTAAKAAPSVGSSKQSVSRIPTCSARVKPFTPAFKASRAQQKRQNLACRAAEEEEAAEAAEAAAPVDDFEFNYSDAKKNNSYTQGDVDSILEAYAEGSGEMAFNDEFFVNITDLEDAAIFEDVDNRDGYEDDMYSSAGIPEAAPVQKRGPRFGAKAENENEDDEAFREQEDAKILEDELAQMGADEQELAGPWGWDISNDDFEDIIVADDADEFMELDHMPADDELIAGIASADMQGLDEETQELIPVLLSDVPVEEISDLYAAEEADDAELDAAVDAPAMSAAEEAGIADVLAIETPTLQLSVAETDAADMAGDVEEEADLDEAMVKEYIKSLQAFGSAAGGADISSVLDDSAEQVSAPTAAIEAVDMADFQIDASLLAEEDLLPEGEQSSGDSIADIVAEYKSLGDIAVEQWSELEIPGDAELDVLDEYLDATGEYLAAMGVGASDDLEAAGAADEPLNMYDDLDSSLLTPPGDDAEEEQLQERLVQLSRVTKVVKGGKLMGFRAVAVVGNMKGRVGVGCDSGREVSVAVKRALLDAKRNVINVPLVGAGTIPHRIEVRHHSALVVLRPASEGTGCIAGSSVRTVLELAGVQNVLAKRIGSRNLLNNARATVKALESLRTLEDVASARGLPIEYLRS